MDDMDLFDEAQAFFDRERWLEEEKKKAKPDTRTVYIGPYSPHRAHPRYWDETYED